MKIPPLRYIKLPPPEINFNLMEHQNTIHFQINAMVADLTDQAVIHAIIKYATAQGLDGICLIDEEFVKSAIIHEIERRESNVS